MIVGKFESVKQNEANVKWILMLPLILLSFIYLFNIIHNTWEYGLGMVGVMLD